MRSSTSSTSPALRVPVSAQRPVDLAREPVEPFRSFRRRRRHTAQSPAGRGCRRSGPARHVAARRCTQPLADTFGNSLCTLAAHPRPAARRYRAAATAAYGSRRTTAGRGGARSAAGVAGSDSGSRLVTSSHSLPGPDGQEARNPMRCSSASHPAPRRCPNCPRPCRPSRSTGPTLPASRSTTCSRLATWGPRRACRRPAAA